ncbi:MAG TPA: glycogen synthase [Steroidobacteraceae bacterium]
MPLRICFVASEVAPLAKTGGLADVTGALIRHLDGGGHDVRAFMPRYAAIDLAQFETTAVDALTNVPLQLGPHHYTYSVLAARLPGSQATVHLIDCPVLYGRPRLYTTDPDEHLRFLALTRAAFECCQRMQWSPQILHGHDWHAGFAALFLKTIYGWDRLFQSTRSILTIHNLGYQGVFPASIAGDLQLGAGQYLLHQDDLRAGFVNSLKHGILYADRVTTVSPTYAREICTPEYGMGLDSVLASRGDAVLGILNGADYSEWDPGIDRYLPEHYDASRLEVKARLKAQLAERLGLACGPHSALAGVVTRLASQKGIDLLLEALPRVLATRDLAAAVLGSGDEPYERAFATLSRTHPGKLAFFRGYSEELAHWIEAASDLFIMPSQYEPCGLNQMYSLRYGTVPVVRETGGLADSVERYDPASGRGTGVLFREYRADALAQALETALDLYAAPAHWRRMARNGMAKDFSWERQAARYVELYELLSAG